MSKKNDIVYCSQDQGEIFPSVVLNEKYSAKDAAYKTLKTKYVRACHQEMLDNYNHTH